MTRATRVAAFWLIGALTTPPLVASSALAQAPAQTPAALLGDGDSVRVTVFQNPDLTTEARISERGSISVPLIGDVAISGVTPEEAAARIADRLVRGKFVIHPQVSLSVQQVRSRQVSVLGEVGKPGRYPLDDVSNSLTDVLARAGGVNGEGDSAVVVVRNQNGQETRTAIDVAQMYRSGDMSHNMRLENGDVVYVKRAPQFYLYGEVQHAGAYRLQPEMTVMQAISVGGGLTPRGTLRGLQVQRRTPDGQVRNVGVHQTDAVRADDVILVRERLF
jgi:polysaccharide export outer membrane protein